MWNLSIFTPGAGISLSRELGLAFFFEGFDTFSIILAVINHAPQSLDTLETPRAHWMSASEHTQLLFHHGDRERRIFSDVTGELIRKRL